MKKIIIITSVLVLLIGVVLSIALYGNSPFNKVKANNVYDDDENKSAVPETRENAMPYMDENNSAVSKESDTSDGVPSRVEVSGDAVQPENDILSNSGEDDYSGNQDNCTYDSKKYGTDDNDNIKEHQVDSSIELEADTKDILASSEMETVCFHAETFIETEEILLLDANTGSTVATMVDDGKYPINGDDLMNDNVFSCKVEIDISKETIYEFYAVIGDTGNDVIVSNTVKITVYAGFTEKDLLDREEVFAALHNLQDNDEFKSMDLDSRVEAVYQLLVELSESGTANAPYSLIVKDSMQLNEDSTIFTFEFHGGDLGATMLVDLDELHGHY